ncbi:tyrosine-type recombinase/integrase [Arthrobacter sp. TB 23]|uniref:tyrosine-type recombinase/integrase n=1 Tax=Arthrobacter sp. TB 23 TaxID=494419 RepID=UPI0002D72B5E|nr:site-specific integrase [Arthrobacter sp. TB 23]
MITEEPTDGMAAVIDLFNYRRLYKRENLSGSESFATVLRTDPDGRHLLSPPATDRSTKQVAKKQPPRIDPKGNVLPAGIRYLTKRPNLPYRVEQEVKQADGSWRSTSKSYQTLAAAKKGLATLKVEIAQGNPPPGKRAKVSLSEFRTEVQSAVVRSDLMPNTVRDYDRAWRIRIMPDLGGYKLGDITSDVVDEIVQSWLETATPSTVCSALAYLSQLLDKAVAKKRINRNPVQDIKRPKVTSATNVGERALTGRQQADLLATMQNQEPEYDRFIQTLLHTGVRFNEATALRVSDVNLVTKRIAVNRAYHLDDDGELVIGPTKGKNCRNAPIPDALIPALNDAMRGKSASAQLLTTPSGSTIRGSNLRRALNWDRIRISIGKPSMCFHDLRHTAATNMLTMGVPLHDVRAILGHSDVSTTNAYSGSHADYATRAADRINNHWSAIVP